MRVAVIIGADRADDDRQRRPCGWRCVGPWRRGRAEQAVARAVLGARHGVGDEHDLAAHRFVGRGGQRLDAVEGDQLAVDRLAAGSAPLLPNAVTASGWGKGAEDFGALRAAHPHRHVERLDADVGEAQRLQLGDRPVAGAGLCLGPGEARADFGRQPFGDVPGIIVLERGIAERGDLRARDERLAAGARGERRRAERRRAGGGDQECVSWAMPRQRGRRSRGCHKISRVIIKASASGALRAAGRGRGGARIWPGAGHISWPRSRTGC